jgi:hypothetical protein
MVNSKTLTNLTALSNFVRNAIFSGNAINLSNALTGIPEDRPLFIKEQQFFRGWMNMALRPHCNLIIAEVMLNKNLKIKTPVSSYIIMEDAFREYQRNTMNFQGLLTLLDSKGVKTMTYMVDKKSIFSFLNYEVYSYSGNLWLADYIVKKGFKVSDLECIVSRKQYEIIAAISIVFPNFFNNTRYAEIINKNTIVVSESKKFIVDIRFQEALVRLFVQARKRLEIPLDDLYTIDSYQTAFLYNRGLVPRSNLSSIERGNHLYRPVVRHVRILIDIVRTYENRLRLTPVDEFVGQLHSLPTEIFKRVLVFVAPNEVRNAIQRFITGYIISLNKKA